MFIFSDHSREISDPATKQILADFQSLYSHLPNGRSVVTIGGAHHFSFSDPAILKSPFLMKAPPTVGGLGKLDARRGLSNTTTYVRTFFDVERKGTPPTLLESVSSQYPEVQFEPR